LLFQDGTLTATWILASTIDVTKEGWWQSMNVGMDTFRQTGAPSKEDAALHMRTHGASHPMRKAT
jgi:hypothetical protein